MCVLQSPDHSNQHSEKTTHNPALCVNPTTPCWGKQTGTQRVHSLWFHFYSGRKEGKTKLCRQEVGQWLLFRGERWAPGRSKMWTSGPWGMFCDGSSECAHSVWRNWSSRTFIYVHFYETRYSSFKESSKIRCIIAAKKSEVTLLTWWRHLIPLGFSSPIATSIAKELVQAPEQTFDWVGCVSSQFNWWFRRSSLCCHCNQIGGEPRNSRLLHSSLDCWIF